MTLLALDTSTSALVLALTTPGGTMDRVYRDLRSHNEELFPRLGELFEQAGVRPKDLEGVVVGSGPGSFTGTRVGWAAALGLAEGLGIGCVAVPTLDALGWMARACGTVTVAVDARRGRVYAAPYREGQGQAPIAELTWEELWAGGLPVAMPAWTVVNGDQNWIPLPGWGEGLLALGLAKFQRGDLVREGEGPLYLRPGV